MKVESGRQPGEGKVGLTFPFRCIDLTCCKAVALEEARRRQSSPSADAGRPRGAIALHLHQLRWASPATEHAISRAVVTLRAAAPPTEHCFEWPVAVHPK